MAIAFTGLGFAQGKSEPKTEQASDKASGGRGKADAQDPNIKGGTDQNKPNATSQAPPNKGGTARGGYCQVHFDNRTAWYVKVYVDGDYKGVVGPWGDGYTYAVAGATKLYARADFTDGTYLHWGPRVISCGAGYTWTLTP